MTRTLSFIAFGVVAAIATGCGGTQDPGAASPTTTTTATPAVACTTPEGATADKPATCAEGCNWNAETLKCEEGTRGVIVHEKGGGKGSSGDALATDPGDTNGSGKDKDKDKDKDKNKDK